MGQILKRRLCGQPITKESKTFCRFHLNQEELKEELVPCPYEPKYMLPKSKLEEHLTKCPKILHQAKCLNKPWHSKGINIMNKTFISDQQPSDPDQEMQEKYEPLKFNLKDIDFDLKDSLISKIESIYDKLKSELQDNPQFNQLFQVDEIVDRFQEMKKAMIEEGKQDELSEFLKHSNQQSKIIDLMRYHGLILEKQDKENLYVEFGAGRAGLSSFVAKKLQELQNYKNSFLVVDRDTRRFKLDKEFKEVFKSFRDKMDIADFDLGVFIREQQSQSAQPGYSLPQDIKIITIAKHLCGGATDLALTSLALQKPELVKGISIATCCHHCCDQATYVNLEFLRELGFKDDKEMQLLPRLTSWGVTQVVKHRKKRVGLKVKKILEYGRCLFIQNKLGMKAYAYQYCDPLTESPENILLLGIKEE